MKVKFQFNSRSSGQNVPEAISIAKKLGAQLEKKFYLFEFDSPDDPHLQKLYQLVGNLKGSVITLDDGEPVNASQFFQAADCQDKLLCKGVCKHVHIGYYPIDQFATSSLLDAEDGIYKTSDVNIIRHLTDFLEPITETRFKFNKDLFSQIAVERTLLERRFCDKYSLDHLKEEIQKLPDEIELVEREEVEFGYGSEEEFESPFKPSEYIASCEIDTQMSTKDLIHCAQILSLMNRSPDLFHIHNTGVMICAFPEYNTIFLLKLHLLEEKFEGEDDQEEGEQELSVEIIKKEEEWYTIRNPIFEMYFQLYEDTDPSLEEKINFLRNMKT